MQGQCFNHALNTVTVGGLHNRPRTIYVRVLNKPGVNMCVVFNRYYKSLAAGVGIKYAVKDGNHDSF